MPVRTEEKADVFWYYGRAVLIAPVKERVWMAKTIAEGSNEKDQAPDSPQYQWWVRLGLSGHLSKRVDSEEKRQ